MNRLHLGVLLLCKVIVACVFACMCAHLLLCDPTHSVLEAPSRLLPASATPSGAPPPLHGACDGHVDAPQLVLTHLQTVGEGRETGHFARLVWILINQKKQKEREKSSSRLDYIVVGLTHLSQVDRAALKLLNGVFSHRHVALCVPTALQGTDQTFRDMHKTTVQEDRFRNILVYQYTFLICKSKMIQKSCTRFDTFIQFV